jgi:hypothetical protein
LPEDSPPLPGLIAQLPADGTSARYRWEIDEERGLGNGKRYQYWTRGSLTIRSVGRENLAGEPCRWIELGTEARLEGAGTDWPPDPPPCLALKLLIPDRALRRGQDPLAVVKRAWYLEYGRVEDLQKDPIRRQCRIDRYRYYFSDVLSGTRRQPTTQIKSSLGAFECEPIEGQHQYSCRLESGYPICWERRLTFWLCERAPFGSVGLETETLAVIAGPGTLRCAVQGRHRLTLNEVRTGADNEIARW